MRSYNHGRLQQQASFLRRQFLQDGDLPFTDVLSEGVVAQALTATGVVWLDRIYSPLVTLWVFLGQVLSADHSCRAAVARLIAHRLSRGERRAQQYATVEGAPNNMAISPSAHAEFELEAGRHVVNGMRTLRRRRQRHRPSPAEFCPFTAVGRRKTAVVAIAGAVYIRALPLA